VNISSEVPATGIYYFRLLYTQIEVRSKVGTPPPIPFNVCLNTLRTPTPEFRTCIIHYLLMTQFQYIFIYLS